jgi:hypothetical protein
MSKGRPINLLSLPPLRDLPIDLAQNTLLGPSFGVSGVLQVFNRLALGIAEGLSSLEGCLESNLVTKHIVTAGRTHLGPPVRSGRLS